MESQYNADTQDVIEQRLALTAADTLGYAVDHIDGSEALAALCAQAWSKL